MSNHHSQNTYHNQIIIVSMKPAKNILKETALSNSQVCTRCFRSVEAKSRRSGNFGRDTGCSDNCGQLGIELESVPVEYSELEFRSERLFGLLEDQGYDLNKYAFERAVEAYSDSTSEGHNKPPKELFIEAIAHGMGAKSTDDLPTNSENNNSADKDSDENVKPINRLASGPQTRDLVSDIEHQNQVEEYISQFDTLEDDPNVCYIMDVEGFQSEFNIEIGNHSPESVANATVQTSWESLDKGSKRKIENWLHESEDPAANYILSSYLVKKCSRTSKPRSMVNDPSEIYRELRGSTLWPVIKREKAQPLLGFIRNHSQEEVPSAEIKNEFEEVDGFVSKLLDVLRTNGQVRRTEDGWKYTGDETNFNRTSAF